MMGHEGKNGGVEIDRDDNGRSDIQLAEQGNHDGSSGPGGYGNAENQQHHQGVGRSGIEPSGELGQSRGEKYDEAQGGGRAPERDVADYGGPKGG